MSFQSLLPQGKVDKKEQQLHHLLQNEKLVLYAFHYLMELYWQYFDA